MARYVEWRDDEYFARKARSYRTAQVRHHVMTHNGEHDLPAGEYVAVQLVGERTNPLYRATEPMFRITLQGGAVWGELGASHLESFCL
jgi:hypothetical protein